MFKSILKDFRQFLFRGNVVDLAVAVVVGAAFTAVVNALVKDLVTPFIGAFGGIPDFSTLAITINNSKILLGDFINSLIIFIVDSAVIFFFIITPINRVILKLKKEEPPLPSTKKCPECLSDIPLKASRCAFCTTIFTDSKLTI